MAKKYIFIGIGGIHGPKPSEFIRFGHIHGPKPFKFIGVGAMDVTKPYKFTGFGASAGGSGAHDLFSNVHESLFVFVGDLVSGP